MTNQSHFHLINLCGHVNGLTSLGDTRQSTHFVISDLANAFRSHNTQQIH